MQTATAATRRQAVPLERRRHPNLLATINVVRDTPGLARFRFVARNRWIAGTHSETTIQASRAPAASRRTRRSSATTPITLRCSSAAITARRPSSSCSTRWRPASRPASAISRRSAGSPSQRFRPPWKETSTCGGFSASRQMCGTASSGIRVNFTIKGDAPPAKLREIVEQSRARSAVYDVITTGARRAHNRRGRDSGHRELRVGGRKVTCRGSGRRIETVVIGGGQAGLAISRCLSARGIGHVVLERGRVAERWRSERWDSLTLLTPNWQSRLPAFSYAGPDPDGFMTMPEVIEYLERYARSFSAPVECDTSVLDVNATPGGFRVDSTSGVWQASTLVIATGHCDVPYVRRGAKASARDLPDHAEQLSPPRAASGRWRPRGGSVGLGNSARRRDPPLGPARNAGRGRAHARAAHVSRPRHHVVARSRRRAARDDG